MSDGARDATTRRARLSIVVLLGLIAAGCGGSDAADQGSIPADQAGPLSTSITSTTELVEPVATEEGSSLASVDLAITDAEFFGLPVSLAAEMSELPEIAFVSPVRGAPAEIAGSVVQVTGVNPVAFGRLVDLGFASGSIEDLVGGGIVLHQGKARELAVNVGDTLPVVWVNGETADVAVVGIFADDVYGSWFVSVDQLARVSSSPLRDLFVLGGLRDGIAEEAARSAVSELLAGYPDVRVEWRSDFEASLPPTS